MKMRVSELKSVVESTVVELFLSVFMTVIFAVLNYMLASIFPNKSSTISLTLAIVMLAMYYAFARSSLANIIKISILLKTIKEWIR